MKDHIANTGIEQAVAGPLPGDALPIAAVERETGLSKDTLRVWERRYGFPQPERDGFDERIYPVAQVERLRLITRLLNSGLRPGRVVPLPLQDLQQMVQRTAPAAAPAQTATELQGLMSLLKRHEAAELRRALNQSVLRLGLAQFLTQVLAPLNAMIGEAWMHGDIQVFEEHMYTESVTALLRSSLGGASGLPQPGRPRVLLTTFPQEPHALGLLMAETMLMLEGCECISLGTQTPVSEIVQAALAHRVQMVGLSFSPVYNTLLLLRGLQELRSQLPAGVEIWAGGSHPVLQRRIPPGVTRVTQLSDIPPLLAAWSAGAPVAQIPG
ncbi:MAG: MerR family transcriptional regulator [Hylemonella sp.]|nr:MerR family transcriptional regulator [Hylemonella sp.]